MAAVESLDAAAIVKNGEPVKWAESANSPSALLDQFGVLLKHRGRDWVVISIRYNGQEYLVPFSVRAE